MPTIHLIREVNCYEREPLPFATMRRMLGLRADRPIDRQSLWLAAEPFNPDEDDYETAAVRLTGPASVETVGAIVVRLRALLERTGIEVREATLADD